MWLMRSPVLNIRMWIMDPRGRSWEMILSNGHTPTRTTIPTKRFVPVSSKQLDHLKSTSQPSKTTNWNRMAMYLALPVLQKPSCMAQWRMERRVGDRKAMGRQYEIVDWTKFCKVPESSGRHKGMENDSCQLINGAPMTQEIAELPELTQSPSTKLLLCIDGWSAHNGSVSRQSFLQMTAVPSWWVAATAGLEGRLWIRSSTQLLCVYEVLLICRPHGCTWLGSILGWCQTWIDNSYRVRRPGICAGLLWWSIGDPQSFRSTEAGAQSTELLPTCQGKHTKSSSSTKYICSALSGLEQRSIKQIGLTLREDLNS